MTDTTREALAAALRRAFSLGQTYWQQADSESYAQNRKADETRNKFEALVAETVAATPEQAQPTNVQDAERGNVAAIRHVAYAEGYKDGKDFARAALATTPAVQAEQPAGVVAWCALTPSGQIAYFDGKPMVMPGPVGNEHHPVPLYVAPRGQAEDAQLVAAAIRWSLANDDDEDAAHELYLAVQRCIAARADARKDGAA